MKKERAASCIEKNKLSTTYKIMDIVVVHVSGRGGSRALLEKLHNFIVNNIFI
jgi:hypothetical protein